MFRAAAAAVCACIALVCAERSAGFVNRALDVLVETSPYWTISAIIVLCLGIADECRHSRLFDEDDVERAVGYVYCDATSVSGKGRVPSVEVAKAKLDKRRLNALPLRVSRASMHTMIDSLLGNADDYFAACSTIVLAGSHANTIRTRLEACAWASNATFITH